MGKGLPGSHSHAKFYRFGLVNVGLQPKKSPKMLTCGIPLPQRGIFPSAIFTKFCLGEGARRPHYSAKFQRCSLKLWPYGTKNRQISFPLSQTSSFQSVTKKNKKKHHTFSSTAGARPRIPTILGMVIEEVRPMFAPPNFF